MTSILTRLKKVKEEEEKKEKLVIAQVFDEKESEQEPEKKQEVVAQQIVQAKVIKQNNPGTPTMGFTLDVLGKQFGLAMEKAMHIAGITSVNAETFGIFDQVGILPDNFEVVTDEYIKKRFYVLNNANRMTEIYKSLAKAIGSTNSEVISFPYTVKHTIKLPLRYDAERNDFEEVEIEVESLYLTQEEIGALNHAFIQEVQYCERLAHQEGSIDLIAFKIDREEWQAMPYRI